MFYRHLRRRKLQAFGLQLEILELMQSQKFSESLQMAAFKLIFSLQEPELNNKFDKLSLKGWIHP